MPAVNAYARWRPAAGIKPAIVKTNILFQATAAISPNETTMVWLVRCLWLFARVVLSSRYRIHCEVSGCATSKTVLVLANHPVTSAPSSQYCSGRFCGRGPRSSKGCFRPRPSLRS